MTPDKGSPVSHTALSGRETIHGTVWAIDMATGDGSMTFIAGALAIGWGILLAAFDSPSVVENAVVQRLSKVLVTTSTALATGGLMYGIVQYFTA